jgi:4-amino-4-deoxy-L-arabinose transferase-like glycosyltransferase
MAETQDVFSHPLSMTARNFAAILARFWPAASLFAIIVLAAVLRIHDIVGDPPGFFADEASFGYNAYTVLHTARDEHGKLLPLFFRAFGEYKLPVYIYSQVPLIALLGLSELPVRLTSAIYGALTVLATYLLVRELFRDRVLALVAAALLAISPWHVFYSRTGLGDITTHLFFIIMGIYLFVLGTRRPMYWPVAGLSFLLALFSYRAAWVLVPPLLAVLVGLYVKEIAQHRRYAILGLLIILLGGVAISWHLLSASGDRAQDRWIFGLHLGFPQTCLRFLSQYGMHFTPGFLFADERPNLRHVIPGVGWLYRWQAPFIVAGALALLRRLTRPKLLVFGLLLLFPIPAAVTAGSPGSNQAILGSVVFSIVTAYGIVSVSRLVGAWSVSWAPQLGRGPAMLLVLGTAVIAGFGVASFLRTYHGSYKQNAAGYYGWQWGARAVVERFVAEENNYDQLVLDDYDTFTEPQIFFRFYAPHDCQRCALGSGNPDSYLKKGQLLAYRQEYRSLENQYANKGTLYYPSGAFNVAFIFAELVDEKAP